MPTLLFLTFCVICGIAIARLGPVLDRIEADKLARLQAAILRAPDPEPSAWGAELFRASVLTILGLAALVLAFTL